LKVLALVGIRKLMDYIFTQKELSYLDDIMPEINKRIEDDLKMGIESDDVGGVDGRCRNDSINITQELCDTKIWKDLENEDSHSKRGSTKRRFSTRKQQQQKMGYLSSNSDTDLSSSVPLVNKQTPAVVVHIDTIN
jgi:hypothetical protein